MQNSSIYINEASATHSGLVRETNEDAFWADSTIRLWVVADGMGGHRAGEVASAIVIKEIPRSIQNGKMPPSAAWGDGVGPNGKAMLQNWAADGYPDK